MTALPQAEGSEGVAYDLTEMPNVVEFCSQLIRFDTSITGGLERDCAEWVAGKLVALGLTPVVLEAEQRRANVVARVVGADPSQPALLVHIHLDVVPADPDQWSVDPYAGEVKDGYVWGRGAVDMKNMAAMTLAALGALVTRSWRPRRDIVFAFVADEELGGKWGARWLVEERADLLAGCTEALGEAGGFSHEYAPGRRVYLVQSAEKGIAWLDLVAQGQGGHGALMHRRSAVARLAEAVRRIEEHDFGDKLMAGTRELVAAAQSWAPTEPGDNATGALAALGPLGRLLAPTLRNTYNTTGLRAGSQRNIVPTTARASIDGRVVPGFEHEVMPELRALVGDLVDVEWVQRTPGVEAAFVGALPDAITNALGRADPGASVLPTLLPISTDAKHFSRLGMSCFGFTPMRVPLDYDFPSMFHGVDERVPVESLVFGQRVLELLLDQC